MSSEFRSTKAWCMQQFLALIAIAGILVTLTLIFDGKTPHDGTLNTYNSIFPLLMLALAAIIPISSFCYIQTYLQFGASRRRLYYAIETTTFILLIITAIFTIGMNQFSYHIYQSLDGHRWNVAPIKWCYLLMLALLIWKSTQRVVYQPLTNATAWYTAKIIALIVVYVALSILCGIYIRAEITCSSPLSTSALYLVNGIIFIISGLIILLLQRSNYRLFMKMEV